MTGVDLTSIHNLMAATNITRVWVVRRAARHRHAIQLGHCGLRLDSGVHLGVGDGSGEGEGDDKSADNILHGLTPKVVVCS